MSVEMSLEWAEPAPSRFGRDGRKWGPVVAELRANPGRWAVIIRASRSPSMVTHIKTARSKEFAPARTFEAVSRRVGKDAEGRPLYDIYARYVGHPTTGVQQ